MSPLTVEEYYRMAEIGLLAPDAHARHRIPEVWIIDVAAPLAHFFHSPHDAGFGQSSSTAQPGLIQLQALPDVAVDLSGLLDYL